MAKVKRDAFLNGFEGGNIKKPGTGIGTGTGVGGDSVARSAADMGNKLIDHKNNMRDRTIVNKNHPWVRKDTNDEINTAISQRKMYQNKVGKGNGISRIPGEFRDPREIGANGSKRFMDERIPARRKKK